MNLQRRPCIDDNLHLTCKKWKHILISFLIGTGIVLLSLAASFQLNRTMSADTYIKVQGQYLQFKERMDDQLDIGENLVRSYEAVIHAGLDVPDAKRDEFLDNLIEDYMDSIRVIGLIEDTTIVFGYPHTGIDTSIGVDLLGVAEQRDAVLKVKEELVSIFIGPIDLVMGGRGYINRVPIFNTDGSYWGQASIVIDAEAVKEQILSIAGEVGLEVLIFQDDEKPEPILGDLSLLEQDPYQFEGPDENGWIIYVLPRDPGNDLSYLRWLILAFGALLGFVLGREYYTNRRSMYLLNHAMAHDPLTGLYNRRYLERVQAIITSKAETQDLVFGLMHIDLDDFKILNDRYGHQKGDEVLQQVSSILSETSRSNELVFRIGGDEFLIVIPDVKQADELGKMRARYERTIRQVCDTDEYLKLIGASLGIAASREHGNDFDEVLKAADSDMYRQKAIHKQNRHASQT